MVFLPTPSGTVVAAGGWPVGETEVKTLYTHAFNGTGLEIA